MIKGFTSITEQVTQAIREGLQEGRWQKTLPGRNRLAAEFGVNHKTVQAALNQLDGEGLLKSQGPGKERLIIAPQRSTPKALRVVILPYQKSGLSEAHLLKIIHRLQSNGHLASFATKTLTGLGMNVSQIAKFVEKTDADAWVVTAGSRGVLEWFAAQKTPAFALYGRLTQVPMAGTSLRKAEALTAMIDEFVKLGHRRIVLLTREERRKPNPGFLEQLFLDRLKEHGINTSSYNLPDWGDRPKELRQAIDAIFRLTPPTALIVDQPSLCISVLQHLSRLGLSAPADVSLACNDYTEHFNWCDPGITHISWNPQPIINRVVKWIDNIGHGKDDQRQSYSKAKLVLTGSIGPVCISSNPKP